MSRWKRSHDLAFFRKRAKNKPSSQNGGIAELVRQVAKFHHPQPPRTVAAIAAWGKKMGPKRGRAMTPKNRFRLRALTNLRTRATLLHLSFHLMDLAERTGNRPDVAA